jgi:hypothetical protein
MRTKTKNPAPRGNAATGLEMSSSAGCRFDSTTTYPSQSAQRSQHDHLPGPGHAICVRIGDAEVRRIDYRGQQVVTFAMIDNVHGRAKDTARKRFNDNRDRFVEGKDFFKVSASEIRTHNIAELSPKATEPLTLITRRGYLKIVKSLNDDTAWAVFGEMIERYFVVEQMAVAAPSIQPGRADAREARLFWKHAMAVAAMAGLEGNQRLLAANKAMRAQLGVDQLAMLGVAALPAPEQEVLLTPTDVGQRLGGLRPAHVNQLLAAHGFQTSGRDAKGRTFWESTPKGLAAGAHMVDVERGNGTGSARQLKWASGIVPTLRELLTTAHNGGTA